MDRRTFIAAAAALPSTMALASRNSPPSLREQVLGTWQIVDAETVNVATGASSPWLGRPRPYTGMIIYLPNGLMAVQIGAARQPSRSDASLLNLSNTEKANLLDTYYAYHGRFEIDEQKSKVRHYVEHSLFESETGTTLVRNVTLTGRVLTLSTENLLPGPSGPTFNRLTWKRVG